MELGVTEELACRVINVPSSAWLAADTSNDKSVVSAMRGELRQRSQ